MPMIKAFIEEEFNVVDSDVENLISLGFDILLTNSKFKNFDCGQISKLTQLYLKTFNFKTENRVEFKINNFVEPARKDIIGNLYENYIHKKIKKKHSGQYYTPENLAEYMVSLLNLKGDFDLFNKKFIDISCGSGVFLTNAVRSFISIARENKVDDILILDRVLHNFYGLDKDPIASLISKINLFITCVNEIKPDVICSNERLDFNIRITDSISKRSIEEGGTNIYDLKNKIGDFSQGFDYIIGNPPYIEAKKLSKPIKEVAMQNFPNFAKGAFDLYIPFVAQCYNISANNGKVCLILPNKITVANYALALRKFLLEKTQIEFIVDFSETKPFARAEVYPVVLLFKNRVPEKTHKVNTITSVKDFNELQDSSRRIEIPQEIYKKATKFKTFFWLPFDNNFYEKLNTMFDRGLKLSEYLDLRTTVSFHKKGQRERYIKKLFLPAEGSNIYLKKYLGGESHSRKNEVSRFKINWSGYYIRYDIDELKKEKINLPPIYVFEREKIIFCQHAREITATLDKSGEWVTKDVFPIAFSKEGTISSLPLSFFVGLFNSKFFSFLYSILFKGIQISQGYFHYLPSWLGELPILLPGKVEIKKISKIVETLMQPDSNIDQILMKQIDDIIYKAYGLNSKEIQLIETSYATKEGKEKKSK